MDSKPHISPEDAPLLKMQDITGDIITDFMSPIYKLQFGRRILSLMLRARSGTRVRDAEVYSRR
jgi:hypothetical protein